jgi:hypothetical protein
MISPTTRIFAEFIDDMHVEKPEDAATVAYQVQFFANASRYQMMGSAYEKPVGFCLYPIEESGCFELVVCESRHNFLGYRYDHVAYHEDDRLELIGKKLYEYREKH